LKKNYISSEMVNFKCYFAPEKHFQIIYK